MAAGHHLLTLHESCLPAAILVPSSSKVWWHARLIRTTVEMAVPADDGSVNLGQRQTTVRFTTQGV